MLILNINAEAEKKRKHREAISNLSFRISSVQLGSKCVLVYCILVLLQIKLTGNKDSQMYQ